MEVAQKLGTRAVELLVRPGSDVWCAHCDKIVKFEAAKGNRQVVCNVYGGRPKRWLRVEHFHSACYEAAGAPHGEADTTNATRLR